LNACDIAMICGDYLFESGCMAELFMWAGCCMG